MNLKGNTVLITGGSEGIGFALAREMVADNDVIICGRDEGKLALAAEKIPGLHTEICDVTVERQRRAMVERLLDSHPKLNVLINNAGAKRHTDLLTGEGVAGAMRHDMGLNFEAPVALCTELLPHFRSLPEAAVVNVTTGLVHLPKAEQTFYCAAKAALHSYTQSLRWVLSGSGVSVHEVLLTLVDTAFHGGKLPKGVRAIGPEEAARRTVRGLRRAKEEIYVGKAALSPWLALLARTRGMAIVNR